MVYPIVNAAPLTRDLGTQDKSIVQLPREPLAIPQHLPKYYFYAAQGPDTPQLLGGAELQRMYGAETFDLRSQYANHATVFLAGTVAQGNTVMAQRIIPDDAGPQSRIIAYLDVLDTLVDDYERNTDGSIKLDGVTGEKIILGQIPGHKVKWVFAPATINEVQTGGYGARTIVPGDQVDQVTSMQSSRYPIFELRAPFKGSKYNNFGIRLWAMTTAGGQAMPTKLMQAAKMYPFNMAVVQRASSVATATVYESIYGEQKVQLGFKPNVIDPLTDLQQYAGDVFLQNYQQLDDPRYPIQHGPFGDFYLYQNNINMLVTKFHLSESTYVTTHSDFTADPQDKFLFNFVSGISSDLTPYRSFVMVDSSSSTRMTDQTNVWAQAGSDGTMNDAAFAASVELKLAEYLDPQAEVQDIAYHVESFMHDSGYPLSTKYAMCNLIAIRHDTMVSLATHIAGEPPLTMAEELSLGIALKTRLQLMPESDYFGTPVCRGIVTSRSGKIRNSQWLDRVPLSYEVMVKMSAFAGAGDGRWKGAYAFDGAPGSIINTMYDVSQTWSSLPMRNRQWDVGINFPLNYDRGALFFPAMKTVYIDDTSVLTSAITTLAVCTLNKIGHAAWREFSGVAGLTNAQLKERVEAWCTEKSRDKFDNRFVIVPEVTFTDMDIARGFSWTFQWKLYADNMKTVMTLSTATYRKSDLAA